MAFWSRRSRKARLRRLVEAHGERAFAVAYRVLGQEADARDALQEALIALDRRLDELEDERALPWLLIAVRHRAVDRFRRRSREPKAAMVEAVSEQGGPGLEAEKAEGRRRVAAALEGLSEQQRAVVSARIYDDRAFAEIARGMGISEGAVKTHFRRGVARLKDLLKGEREG